MNRFSFSRITLLNFSFFLLSCGNYDSHSSKEYIFYIDEADSSLRKSIEWLAEDLNGQMNHELIVFTNERSKANSSISFVDAGSEFGKFNEVGWGKWKKETEYETEFVRLQGRNPKKKSTYSMELLFDRSYFSKRSSKLTESNKYDLKKLFAHEVFHGLGGGHDDDNPKSIMYKDVAASHSSEKDFKVHYQKMKDYFINF